MDRRKFNPGRKPLDGEIRKSVNIAIRLTKKQKAELWAVAKQAGYGDVSKYARDVLLKEVSNGAKK